MFFAITILSEYFYEFFKTGILAGGTAAFFFSIIFLGIALARIFSQPKKRLKQYIMEEDRLTILRRESVTFRIAEPFIRDLIAAPWNKNRIKLNTVSEQLTLLHTSVPWKPEEFVAVKQAESILLGMMIGMFFWNSSNPIAGSIAGFCCGWGYYFFMMSDLKDRYKTRLHELRTRLPFVVDLMAMTRGAGASFTESLESAALENKGHPISDELNHVIMQLKHGVTQQKSLEDLAERVRLDEFNEVVFAINKADELGTPIAFALSELAGQMRLRRQQLGEKASEEAEVKLTGPVMLIVVACMIIAVAPFLLPVFLKGGPVMF
ncbi:MAG: type II secretion system F family protein [Planctomycetaceae bacterium]|jgi:Flp pilus assembly protein TadB|nr:type II secretion system F family protein [Planctomycetaceae bacterium]